MNVLRAFAAATAALSFILATTVSAAPAPGAMPPLPERGRPITPTSPSTRPLPKIGDTTDGVSPSRLEKTIAAAKAGTPPPIRGKREQGLFATFSRSVVLIVTPDTLGTGTIVNADGTILTNWHVVRGLKSVGVIFKPATDKRPTEADAVRAQILRVDEIADLALIKVATMPDKIRVVAFADPAKIAVGLDVHAIGHPFGEIWSYTKGVVSQIRPAYAWKDDAGTEHKADVVQMQTPTNPGNAGGPLLNDAGELIGTVTFGAPGSTGVNFAIAAGEIRRFMGAAADRRTKHPAQLPRKQAQTKECAPTLVHQWRAKAENYTASDYDIDCDGKPEITYLIPDNPRDPIIVAVDANRNGKLEIVYVDRNGDGKFEEARYDNDEDGNVDLIGYDLNDTFEPARIERVRK